MDVFIGIWDIVYTSEGEKHHVKNDDEIYEYHKSQLKFKYEVYSLTYTMKRRKKTFKNLKWDFDGFQIPSKQGS